MTKIFRSLSLCIMVLAICMCTPLNGLATATSTSSTQKIPTYIGLDAASIGGREVSVGDVISPIYDTSYRSHYLYTDKACTKKFPEYFTGVMTATILEKGDGYYRVSIPVLSKTDLYMVRNMPLPVNLKIPYGTTKILGDLNDDGTVDATDASMALEVYAKVSTGQPNATYWGLPDLNVDGTVDATDASGILEKYANASTGNSEEMIFQNYMGVFYYKDYGVSYIHRNSKLVLESEENTSAIVNGMIYQFNDTSWAIYKQLKFSNGSLDITSPDDYIYHGDKLVLMYCPEYTLAEYQVFKTYKDGLWYYLLIKPENLDKFQLV